MPSQTVYTEGSHPGEHIVRENPMTSRTIGAILAAGNDLEAGTVLGLIDRAGSGAVVTGSIAATTLTVTVKSSGTLTIGQTISGSNVTSNSKIIAYGTGRGGTGTYTLDKSSTATSTTITAVGATIAAFAHNASGTGVIASVALSAGVKPGVYTVTMVEEGTAVGTYVVEDPDGVLVGTGVVAAAFTGGGLTFTVPDGTPDFKAGEGFTITVLPGSGEYTALNLAAANGANVAAGILYAPVDATDAPTPCCVNNWDTDVNGDEIVWPTAITAAQIATATAQLAALRIRVFDGVAQ
jgi:hypothetical protein